MQRLTVKKMADGLLDSDKTVRDAIVSLRIPSLRICDTTVCPRTRGQWSRAGGSPARALPRVTSRPSGGQGRSSTGRRASDVWSGPVSIRACGQAVGRTRARSAEGSVGTDGVDQDAMVAGGAGVGVGQVEREEGGEPAEGQGRVIVADGAQGEGVVGAAVGAGGARAGVTHGGSLWRRLRRPPVRRAAARGRHGS